MNHCKTCKHWCGDSQRNGRGFCDLINNHSPSLVSVDFVDEDGEYFANIWTAAEFGCVLHEEKSE